MEVVVLDVKRVLLRIENRVLRERSVIAKD